VSERFYVALARRDAGVRGMGGSDESAAAAGALRKGWPMNDALLAPGPNFKTLTSTLSISFD